MTSVPVLRARPVELPAIEYTGTNIHDINVMFLGRRYQQSPQQGIRAHPHGAYPPNYPDGVTAEVWNSALSLWQPVRPGDWIVQGTQGELYPVSAETIVAEYESPDA